jgi:hypothetical protein
MKLKLCIVSLYLSASSAFMPNSLLQTNRPKLHSSILSAKAKAGSSEEGSKEDKNKTAKRAALDGVLQKIERSYGRGSIVKLGDADNMLVECISSGALTLGKLCVTVFTCLVDECTVQCSYSTAHLLWCITVLVYTVTVPSLYVPFMH